MSKRSRASGANVSFFAFQDIITSVTGILILIVMFLIISLEQPGLLTSEEPVPEISLDELKKRIAEGLETIRKVEELRIKAGGASEEDLRAQIAELKAGLTDKPESTNDKDVRVQVEEAEKEVEAKTKSVADLMVKKSELEGEVDKIKGLTTSKADGLAHAKNSSNIWLHKGENPLKPIILDVYGDRAVLRDLEDAAKAEEMNVDVLGAGVDRLISSHDKASSYFVFFVRPSGITLFKQVRQKVVEADYSVGFNAIDEETVIQIAPD